MTDEDFSHALDAMRLASKKAAPVQSEARASKWMRWLWIAVAIIVLCGLLALGVLVVIAMGLLASA
jgi:bacteriorhodopsin